MKYRFARTTLALLSAAFSVIAYAGDVGKVTPTWAQPAEANVGWDSGDYAYDYSGNIAQIGKDLFGYDGANRLTASTIKAYGVTTSQSFRYDRYGNLLHMATTIARTGAEPENVDTTLDVDAMTNRLRTVCNPCQSWGYDDAGNQKQLGTDLMYSWDATGAMTELVGSGAHERYVYDANGERIVMISVAGAREVVRRWTWRDAENKVAREAVEHVGEDKWAEGRDYVYRSGALLASFESAGATVAERHYHVDHLGTPRLITDAGRKKMAVEAYLPFGERAPGREAAFIGFGDRMQFTGHERDGDGSPYRPTLDYMHARYYMPKVGRFTSVDTATANPARPQTWNRYVYSSNSPIQRFDPDGKQDRLSAGQFLSFAGKQLGDSLLHSGDNFLALLFGVVNGDPGLMGRAAANHALDVLSEAPGIGGFIASNAPRFDLDAKTYGAAEVFATAMNVAKTADVSSNGKPIVLWSGDKAAVAARRLANNIGGVTLADTEAGSRLKNIDMSSLSYQDKRAIWLAASFRFVANSSAAVHVFPKSAVAGTIQADIEITTVDPKRLVYHEFQ